MAYLIVLTRLPPDHPWVQDITQDVATFMTFERQWYKEYHAHWRRLVELVVRGHIEVLVTNQQGVQEHLSLLGPYAIRDALVRQQLHLTKNRCGRLIHPETFKRVLSLAPDISSRKRLIADMDRYYRSGPNISAGLIMAYRGMVSRRWKQARRLERATK